MWPKELTLMGGHTKDGKTSLAVSIIIANLKENTGVFYASHEMDREAVFLRMAAQETSIPFKYFRDPRQFNDADWDELESFREMFDTWPLIVNDSGGMEIGKLGALMRLHARRDNTKL